MAKKKVEKKVEKKAKKNPVKKCADKYPAHFSEAQKKAARKRPQTFKKGNTAAKGKGRPRMSPEEKALALASRTQFKALLTRYMTLDMDQISDALERGDLPVIDIAVLRCLKVAGNDGSMDRIDWALNHILGKPKEETNINVNGSVQNEQTIDLKKLSKEELISLREMAKRGADDKK